MKCRCGSCQTKLAIDNDQLRKLKKPIFKCPKCKMIIQIQAQKARCGKCKSSFGYYPYKFDSGTACMKCPECETINRIKIHG